MITADFFAPPLTPRVLLREGGHRTARIIRAYTVPGHDDPIVAALAAGAEYVELEVPVSPPGPEPRS